MHLELATQREAVGGSRYRVLGRLGSGGMADVDLALQTGVAGSSRLCVLKRVRKELASRPEFVAMFFEEARISASLNHPNVVQVYEVGGDEHDCFLAMEFLRGRSFAQVLRGASGLADYRVALEVLIATLSGLEHAHGRRDLAGAPMQLVHRDVSPPNVFVSYDGEIKVLDFGVAKSKDSLIQTKAGILKGKVAYMAPELVAGEALDARADLFAVGVMLWEATAGRDRWPNLNDMAILSQLARLQEVEAPGAELRGLPELADRISVRALATRPAQRHQTAAELRSDLVRLCELLGGRLSQGDIASYMQGRFAAQRQREEREIEQALQAQRGAADDAEVATTKRVSRRGSTAPEAPGTSPAVAAPSRRSSSELGVGTKRFGLIAAALALALLVAVVALARAFLPSSVQPTGATSAAAGASASASSSQTALTPTVVGEANPASVAAAASAEPTEAQPREPAARSAPKQTATPKTSSKAPKQSLQLDRQDPWQ